MPVSLRRNWCAKLERSSGAVLNSSRFVELLVPLHPYRSPRDHSQSQSMRLHYVLPAAPSLRCRVASNGCTRLNSTAGAFSYTGMADQLRPILRTATIT
jgi:hypothetical protein